MSVFHVVSVTVRQEKLFSLSLLCNTEFIFGVQMFTDTHRLWFIGTCLNLTERSTLILGNIKLIEIFENVNGAAVISFQNQTEKYILSNLNEHRYTNQIL